MKNHFKTFSGAAFAVLVLTSAVSAQAATCSGFGNCDFASTGTTGSDNSLDWSKNGSTNAEIVNGTGHVWGNGTESSSSAGILKQTFTGLAAGQVYTVSFSGQGSGFVDVTTSAGGSIPYDLNVAGSSTDSNPIDSNIANTVSFTSWQGWMKDDEIFVIDSESQKDFSFSFTASADGVASVWFKSIAAGASGANQLGLYFDNVSLTQASVTTAVPEPETYAMMLAGLGAMGLMSRRRRAK